MLLSYGSPDEIRDYCRKVIDGVAREGGYILDASAIMQNDTDPENLRAMTTFVREYGIYPQGHSTAPAAPKDSATQASNPWPGSRPGVCIPWEEERVELGPIQGDEAILRRIWEQIDALGDMYIWQVLLSF